MARWAIGDVQGCGEELDELLARIRFSAERDQLWFVGDLVNRGPHSLQVLRLVRSLGANARHACSAITTCICWRWRWCRPSSAQERHARCGPERAGSRCAARMAAAPPLAHYAAPAICWCMRAGAAVGRGADAALAAEVAAGAASLDPSGCSRSMYGDQPDRWQHVARGRRAPALCGQCADAAALLHRRRAHRSASTRASPTRSGRPGCPGSRCPHRASAVNPHRVRSLVGARLPPRPRPARARHRLCLGRRADGHQSRRAAGRAGQCAEPPAALHRIAICGVSGT